MNQQLSRRAWRLVACPFDDLARNTSFAPGASITSGDSIVLKVGEAVSAESKAIVGADIAGRPGNSLGIIAILIGMITGDQSASEVEFVYKLDSGPAIVRVNGRVFNVPNLEALNGQSLGGVQISVGPGDVSGDSVFRLRATGAIDSFAVGGMALWIDDVCVKAPGGLASRIQVDLGDAPDGSNHWGAAMSAYPGVPARFPTVFDPAAAPVGPAHRTPRPFHLGQSVSGEANADWGFDADGINNINPPVNAMDDDRFDDGLNPTLIPFVDCTKPTFPVQLSISPVLASLPNGRGYVNVWVDSNRDGDWEDAGQCTPPGSAPVRPASTSWLTSPLTALLGPGLHTVTVSANRHVRWPSNLADKPAWLRITLSEAPAVKQPATGVGDGRGRVPPFLTGETEDYLSAARRRPGQWARRDDYQARKSCATPHRRHCPGRVQSGPARPVGGRIPQRRPAGGNERHHY